MADRSCLKCSKPLHSLNITGFCTTNAACRAQNRRIHNAAYDRKPNRPRQPKPVNRYPAHPWELYEAYDDEGDLIIDAIAIEIAILGIRKVRLTPTERRIVTARMILRSEGFQTIQQHLSVGRDKLVEIMDSIGYEVVSDSRHFSGGSRVYITRKDRKRKVG